jgi:hypothetical protein
VLRGDIHFSFFGWGFAALGTSWWHGIYLLIQQFGIGAKFAQAAKTLNYSSIEFLRYG